MKSYYLFLFCILLFLFSCKEEVNTFYSIDYKKTFQYDSNWEVSDDIENINFISILNTKDTNDDFQSNVNFIIIPTMDTRLGDDYLYIRNRQAEALERKGYSIIEEKEIGINKQRALYIIANKTIEEKRYTMLQTLQLYNGVLIEGTFISEAISFREFQESAEFILQSFKYYVKPPELDNKDNYGREYDSNRNLSAYGPIKENKKEGLWSFYSRLGLQIETGHYTNGLKTGDWGEVYTNENASPRIKKTYINDSLEGSYTSYFDNKQIDSTGTFLNNKQIGAWISYYNTGIIYKKGEYKKGKKENVWNYYHSTGEIYTNGQYTNGKKQGVWEYFYTDGTLEKIEKYSKGVEDSIWVGYHPNGLLKHKNYYSEGLKIGTWKSYYTNGQLRNKSVYNSGKLDGGSKTFTRQGKSLFINSYKEGKKHGNHKHFNPLTGEPIKEEVFFEGKKHTTQKEYYTKGQLKKVENYSHGKKQGKFFSYYENGQLKEEKIYDNNILDGVFKSYFKNGQLEKVNTRKSNRIIETTEYYNNGQLKTHESYTLKKTENYLRPVSNGDLESYYENGGEKEISQKVNNTDYYITTYYPNGNIESKSFYQNGFISGKKYEYQYKSKDQIYKITAYQNGLENGPYVEYYSNGNIREEGIYLEGHLDDTLKVYYDNGTLARIEFRASKELQNELIEYHLNGNIELIISYKDGIKHGKETYNYANGQEAWSRIYNNNRFMEIGKTFDKNGNELPSGTLKKGNGTVNFYDENGLLINQKMVIEGLMPSY